MQTQIDLLTVYRGKLSSLFPGLSHKDVVKGIRNIQILLGGNTTNEYKVDVNRTKNSEGFVDTIYVTTREAQGVVAAYVECQYGNNHFETYVSPTHRAKSLAVIFELEVSDGTTDGTQA